MSCPRLHWMRGRVERESGIALTAEWVGLDESGEAIARVVRLKAPNGEGPADADAKVIELRPKPPRGAGWLACIGPRVVGRAALPLQAVRTAEEALAGGE